MTSTFQDTVLDFDLNFLQQSSSNAGSESRLDRQKKAILIAKKKTIATDLLIRKYYDKKEKLEQSEVKLLASKEECKQVCIDYKQSTEKCSQLEKVIQLLQNQYTEVEQKYITSQNQLEAMKSHTRQLQVLVKENETATEAIKIDSFLEKSNVKELKKRITSLQREKEEILNHLCIARDIAFGKKKLNKHHRSTLQKYESITSKKNPDCSMSEESCEETDFFDDSPTSPLYTVIEISPEGDKKQKVNDITNKNEACVNQDSVRVIEDHESDYSNGVVSEDTGRGSSLAFSDLEKCVNSPDYFTTDSPPVESAVIKNRKKTMDASTSPRKNQGVHIATSPLIFDDEALQNDNSNSYTAINSNQEYFITDNPMNDESVTLKEKRQLIDSATSPIRDIEKLNKATSPIAFIPISEIAQCLDNPLNQTNICDKNIIPDNNVNKNVSDGSNNDVRDHVVFEDLSNNHEFEINDKTMEEKMSLENNNNLNLQNENSNDFEVEMILNSMRMTHRLITPLPLTPVKLNKKSKQLQMHLDPVPERSETTKKHSICLDAVELREENKSLKTSIADLTKEILNIKSILKKQFLMPESPKKSAPVNNNESEALKVICDSSQENITIVCDENTENISKENDLVDEKLEVLAHPTPPVQNINETLHKNNDHGFTQDRLRCDVMNTKEINNFNKHSNHMSPEPFLSPSEKENQNSIEYNSNVQTKYRENLSFHGDGIGNVVEDNPVSNCKTDPIDSISISKPTNVHIGRRKKLSRLDKFRRKLAPKSKIKFKVPPMRKKRAKSKIIPVNKIHPPETVNNKIAYEKAIKVLRELKLKKNISKKDSFISSSGKKGELNNAAVNNVNIKPNSNNSELQGDLVKSPCKEQNETKQFVVCLSRLNLEKHMQNIKESKIRLGDQSKCFSPERISRERTSIENVDSSPTKNIITTRSRSKMSELGSPVQNDTYNKSKSLNILKSPKYSPKLDEAEEIIKKYDRSERVRQRLKRVASDNSDVSCKRVLRSSSVRERANEQVPEKISPRTLNYRDNIKDIQEKICHEDKNKSRISLHAENRSNKILDASNDINNTLEDSGVIDPRESIICKMIEKYGRGTVKFIPKKIPGENITNELCKKLNDDIGKIIKLPIEDSKSAINQLVNIIQGWNRKYFILGLMKYLKNPARKAELYNKVVSSPAPAMTKSEQVLLYILKELEVSTPDIVNTILIHIEFALFHLNRTPEFDVIESLSHFYALTCRYFRLKTRLRVFLLDAMYCLQFKVIPLIKQCLDVWMHILPLAHMGIAKSQLVTCLVYLLHFYKCEDRLNRIQEIRFILNKKYFYKMTDWNEPKILEMFKNSITELREIPLEKKMLRLAFIILAKRHGPKWCQKNIIKNILTPVIENEDAPLNTKKFCVSLLGPLLKPYPKDMKVHCEIAVNQLLDKLEQNPPDDMKEAIFTSLIYMNKHNQSRVTQALLSWSPKKPSEEFEQLMCDFIREKPVRVWKGILSKIIL